MNAIASLLLVTAMLIPTPTLVLKSGKRIDVEQGVRVENGRVLFRSNRTLYSVPSDEVDFEATRAAGAPVITVTPAEEPAKLKVKAADKERLLRTLEKNHSGTPASKEQLDIPESPKKAQSETTPQGDEWSWRRAARDHEESVRRAQEELEMLHSRAAELKSKIAGLLSQGYRGNQFSYETTQLAMIEEQIPRAELELRRAERAQREFMDDARRQNVLPGWLR